MEKELEVGSEPENQPKKVTKLEGDEALLLWLKGKGAWNEWMEGNPKAEVSFEDVEFSYSAISKRLEGKRSISKKLENHIDFSGYNFNQYTSFDGAVFEAAARFWKARFLGPVSFFCVQFKDSVTFIGTEFQGRADFSSSIFRYEANFHNVKFKEDSGFYNAQFTGACDFYNIEVSGEANFRSSVFSDEAYFVEAEFKSYALFHGAKFFGSAEFSNVIFNKDFSLEKCKFLGSVGFQGANFCAAFYCLPSNPETIAKIDFKGASFEKAIFMSGNFNCIPDLRLTKVNHHVDLSKLEIRLSRSKEQYGALREMVSDPNDAERLCRLKEIAESNKNQKRALAFHADEQRASRWGILNPWQSILDSLYSLTSNYGQSVLRPFVFLMMSIFVFSHITLGYADSKQDAQFKTALVISVATVTPFMATSKDARNNSIKKIFSNDIPESYYIYGYLHSFFSFIFIFLIGLGLRNRFRI